MENYCN